MKYDFCIIGSGPAGLILAERIANINNQKVLVIEKRNHIGGNLYDHYDTNGILIHKYGPHFLELITLKFGSIYQNLQNGIIMNIKLKLL